MVAILWLVGIVTLLLGVLLLRQDSVGKISKIINSIVLSIDSENKYRLGCAISLILIAVCSFFLAFYYTK